MSDFRNGELVYLPRVADGLASAPHGKFLRDVLPSKGEPRRAIIQIGGTRVTVELRHVFKHFPDALKYAEALAYGPS